MNISELLKLVQFEYPNIDFKKLLNNFTSSNQYKPYDESLIKFKENLNFILEKKDYKKLIETCYNIFLINPFDIESHILASKSAKSLNKVQLEKIHHIIASKLLDLILLSGNGTSYEKAYIINFPEDEIAVFTYLQNYPTNRINQDKNGRIYDIFSMQKGQDIFFDVTMPFMTISGEK